jgi:hypothetical protein
MQSSKKFKGEINIMKIQLDMEYKGERKYIQGGDIFNSINASISKISEYEGFYISKLVFNKFCYSKPVLNFGLCSEQMLSVANGVITNNDVNMDFWLQEGKIKPSTSKPFNEEELVSRAKVLDRTATLIAPIECTPIEAVIALTKMLNNSLTPAKIGKWVFGKIELSQKMRYISSFLSITSDKSIEGRYSINTIIVDGKEIGRIKFIVGIP